MSRLAAGPGVPLALAALILTAVGCGQRAATTSSPRSSDPSASQGGSLPPAPDFTLTTFEGTAVQLRDFNGNPLVLNFWESWSARCASRASALDAFYQEHKGQGLQVVGIGVDAEQNVRAKAEEIKLSYPVGADAEVARKYGVTELPHTFFISREGKILASLSRGGPEECLQAGVEMALASEGPDEHRAARDRFGATVDAHVASRQGNEALRRAEAIRDGGGDLGEEWHRLIGEAIESYERAVALNPDLWQALYELSLVLLWQAEAASDAEAERLRRLALEKTVAAHVIQPKSWAAYNAAQLHALLGEPGECRKWLATARESDALPPVEHMQSDADLDSVRDEEWFQEYLHR